MCVYSVGIRNLIHTPTSKLMCATGLTIYIPRWHSSDLMSTGTQGTRITIVPARRHKVQPKVSTAKPPGIVKTPFIS